MAMASVMSATLTGIEEPTLLPFPSWPSWLLPQHDMVPFWWSAQECKLPAVMAVASVMSSICTGNEVLVYVPLTNWIS